MDEDEPRLIPTGKLHGAARESVSSASAATMVLIDKVFSQNSKRMGASHRWQCVAACWRAPLEQDKLMPRVS